VHALEGDGAGPTRHKHGGEFGGGSLTEGYGDGRPNRAAALGLRRAAASGNRRSPEARRFELPATVSKFEHTVVTRRARRIRPGGF